MDRHFKIGEILLNSGETYDQINSPQGIALLGTNAGKNRIFESPKSHDFEVQLSEESLVYTFETIGELSVDNVKQSAQKYWKRIVFLGDFEYDLKGVFLGGVVRKLATWDYGVSRLTGSTHEMGMIYKSNTDIKVTGVVNSNFLFRAIMQNGDQLFDYVADYGDNGFRSGDPKSSFYGYQISQFFDPLWWESPFSGSSDRTSFFHYDHTKEAKEILDSWLEEAPTDRGLVEDIDDTKILNIVEETWSGRVQITRIAQAKNSGGDLIKAKQVNKSEWNRQPKGSVLIGSDGNDILKGLAGWDVIDGGAGDDLIRGGNGRDIITGGTGSDELHGDFGWNTYKNQRDGYKDLVAIKSDQILHNHWLGQAGNNSNGGKCDIIEGLDANDQIIIIGASDNQLSIREQVDHKGVSGIGIYADGALEALYTGGNLSDGQIRQMTSGDASELAMNNQMWSYWGNNTPPGRVV